MLPTHGRDEAFPAQIAQQLTGIGSRRLTDAQAHHPPAEPGMVHQIAVPHTLHRFRHAQMTMGEHRILLVGMERADRIAQIGTLPLPHLRNTLPRFDRRTFILRERFSQSIRSMDAHGHLAMLETRAALSGQQIHVIADAVQMRPFGPHDLHAVSSPDDGFHATCGLVILNQRPCLRIDALGPDLGLPLPLREGGGSGLRPIHGSVAILENVGINTFGASNPERPAPRPLDVVGLDDEVSVRKPRLNQLFLRTARFDRLIHIDTRYGARNHVFACDSAQCGSVDAARILHERNEQAAGHVRIDGIRDMRPVRKIVGNVDGQTGNELE